MALEDSINDGVVAFFVLLLSISIYLYLEKRKYMQKQKIRAYAKMVNRLKHYFNILKPVEEHEKLNEEDLEQQKELEKRELEKISDLSSELVFYGSADINRKVKDLIIPDITSREIRNLIIEMRHEIEGYIPRILKMIPINRIKQRYIQLDDVFFIKGLKIYKFKTEEEK